MEDAAARLRCTRCRIATRSPGKARGITHPRNTHTRFFPIPTQKCHLGFYTLETQKCLHARGLLSAAEVGARRTPKGATGSPQRLCYSQARRRRPYLESTHTFLPTVSAAGFPPPLPLFLSACLSVLSVCLSCPSVRPSVCVAFFCSAVRFCSDGGLGHASGEGRVALRCLRGGKGRV